MAGWICQTRKIIATVVSSLADDLEQTVQELNDVIYRFGGTHADSSSTNPLTLPDGIPDTDSPHLEEQPPEKQHQLDPTVEEARPHNQLKEKFKSTLTRQPETSGFPSTLNSRLSQSSPTLQISENGISGLEDSRLSSMSSFHSMISSSSPCLMQIPGTSAEPPDRTSLSISGRHLRQPHLYSKSLQSFRVSMKPGSQNVCPCHRRDSFKITHGMKHPGRVIRTQSSVALQQSQSPIGVDPTQEPLIEEPTCSSNQMSRTEILGGKPDDDFNSPRRVLNLKDRESDSQLLDREHGSQQIKREHSKCQLQMEQVSHQLNKEPLNHQLDREPSNHQLQKETDGHQAGEASLTPALVEHNTHFLTWASLRPFTRILSFAFAQLANVVLLFSENSQSDHNLTSSNSAPETESKHHEVTSAVYPVGIGDHGQIETTYKRVNEQEVQHLNVAQRTYSTDSFEIIESSCFNGAAEEDPLHQRLIPEYQTNQTSPKSCSDSLDNRLEFSSNHFSSDHSIRGSGAPIGTSTSSTEWVSFDFRKLLTDGQFGLDKPMLASFSQGSSDVNSRNVDTDYEVVGENIRYQSVNGDSNNGCHRDSGRDDDSDDDKDSSASFIILSDNDINELIL